MTSFNHTIKKLGDALNKKGRDFSADEVSKLIEKVLEKLEQQNPPPSHGLIDDLKGLIDCIQSARQDVSSLSAEEIKSIHIPIATDELDAVVGATEEATGAIMDACEAIEAVDMPQEAKDKVIDQITKIYEACSFQDITGQRISKVVGALKEIEEKTVELLRTMGVDASEVENKKPVEKEGDDALLNGPALNGQGMGQDDIDALLASFDD